MGAMGAEEDLKPESVDALSERASDLLVQGKYQEAARYFHKALKALECT
jgi:hypothetical protein